MSYLVELSVICFLLFSFFYEEYTFFMYFEKEIDHNENITCKKLNTINKLY